MNKFDTLANSILESLNEADAVNVATNITNKLPTFANKVVPLNPDAKPFWQPDVPKPVGPAPTTNQPPRNVGGVTPTYDPNKDPLLKGIPGFKPSPPRTVVRRPPPGDKIYQDYLKRRREIEKK